MAIKGLRGFRFCVCEEDSESILTYESVIQKLLGARNIKISPKTSSGELRGDDGLILVESSIDSIEVEIDVAELTLEERAILTGQLYKKGVLKENKDATTPIIAFGFMAPLSSGGMRRKWLLKGQVEPLEEEAKTKEDKVEFQTQKVKIKFMPRIHDGELTFTSDSNAEGAPTDEQFFSTEFLTTGEVATTPPPSGEAKKK